MQYEKETITSKHTIMIKSIKLQQLEENFKASESEMSFAEYVKRESENDPSFWGWLFDDGNLEDYSDLSLEQSNSFDEMLESIASKEVELGACEIHLGLHQKNGIYYIDVIDKDGNVHKNYAELEADNRAEAEDKAKGLYEGDKVIFDY